MKTRLFATVMAIVLLLGLMGIAAQAETLQSPDSRQVLLFKSQDRMDFAIKHLASGGSYKIGDEKNILVMVKIRCYLS